MYNIYSDIWWEILRKKRLESEGVQLIRGSLIKECLIKSKMPLSKTIVFFLHSIKTPFTVDFFEIGLKREKKWKESFVLLYKTGMGVWIGWVMGLDQITHDYPLRLRDQWVTFWECNTPMCNRKVWELLETRNPCCSLLVLA